MSMDAVFTGKAADVINRIKLMKDMAAAGGGALYDGFRRPVTGETIVMKTSVDESGRFGVAVLDPAPVMEAFTIGLIDFEWGYGGAGADQLALALLLDAAGDRDLAMKYHQQFKEAFCARWQGNWCMEAGHIRRWVGLKGKYAGIKEA